MCSVSSNLTLSATENDAKVIPVLSSGSFRDDKLESWQSWSIAAAWKAVIERLIRGFESRTLRTWCNRDTNRVFKSWPLNEAFDVDAAKTYGGISVNG